MLMYQICKIFDFEPLIQNMTKLKLVSTHHHSLNNFKFESNLGIPNLCFERLESNRLIKPDCIECHHRETMYLFHFDYIKDTSL